MNLISMGFNLKGLFGTQEQKDWHNLSTVEYAKKYPEKWKAIQEKNDVIVKRKKNIAADVLDVLNIAAAPLTDLLPGGYFAREKLHGFLSSDLRDTGIVNEPQDKWQ